MSDSSDIDDALVAKLLADKTLSSLMPDGVFIDESNPGATRFVIVSLVNPHEERVFGARAFEDAMYLVKAVALSTANANMKAAAARIDALLDPQPRDAPSTMTVPGYSVMTTFRDTQVPRVRVTEVDQLDTSKRWFHRGGHYHVVVSL